MNSALYFWAGVFFTAVLGLGLSIDAAIVIIYWGRRPEFFKQNINVDVPWLFKDFIKICIILFLLYLSFYSVEYTFLKSGLLPKKLLRHISTIINTLGIYILGLWIINRIIKLDYHLNLRILGIKWHFCLRKCFKALFLYISFLPILFALIYAGIMLCNGIGIEPKPHILLKILEREKNVWFVVYLLTTAIFIAPVFEEIIFRGFFYQTMKKYTGFWGAIIISSAVFSLLHFNAAQFLPIMGLGVLLCFVFEYTKSLIPAIFIHILNNAIFLGLFLVFGQHIK